MNLSSKRHKLGCGTLQLKEPDVPIVTVQQSPRDLEPKRKLVAGITQAFVDAYGITPDAVQVFIDETGDENWAKGGKLAVDRA